MTEKNTAENMNQLFDRMRSWARSLGFQKVGVSDIELKEAENHLHSWLSEGFHGEMEFMSRHGSMRSHPEQLVEGTIRVITLRMDYWPLDAADPWRVISDKDKAFISRYALGRDYHKIIRKRLVTLAQKIEKEVGEMGYRVFTDSAPILEKAIAEKAGLGWIGKHSNLLSRDAGSYFFLGEIFTDLPLPLTETTTSHCGSCRACLDACPTQAIVSPYRVDARRCISYLTIELKGSIPIPFRSLMGNRIYGCDDCQLVCPWNKFANSTSETDFYPRHNLDAPDLVDLFSWSETTFLSRLEGSPIRRIGYERWLRNIAVALGNANTSQVVIQALESRLDDTSEVVREHVTWALSQHTAL